MKIRNLIVILLIIFLLAGSTAVSRPASALTNPANNIGSSYTLNNLEWQLSGVSSDGGYFLFTPTEPALRGNGCCCLFLPCVVKDQ